jgi:hypothetical protein
VTLAQKAWYAAGKVLMEDHPEEVAALRACYPRPSQDAAIKLRLAEQHRAEFVEILDSLRSEAGLPTVSEAVALVASGLSLHVAGAQLGISLDAMRWLMRDAGLTTKGIRDAAAARVKLERQLAKAERARTEQERRQREGPFCVICKAPLVGRNRGCKTCSSECSEMYLLVRYQINAALRRSVGRDPDRKSWRPYPRRVSSPKIREIMERYGLEMAP